MAGDDVIRMVIVEGLVEHYSLEYLVSVRGELVVVLDVDVDVDVDLNIVDVFDAEHCYLKLVLVISWLASDCADGNVVFSVFLLVDEVP